MRSWHGRLFNTDQVDGVGRHVFSPTVRQVLADMPISIKKMEMT